MSTNTQPRQPSGTPVGGQFAGKANPEPDVELAAQPDFGAPWGNNPAYTLPDGRQVAMWRKGQRVRFYDTAGDQVGPEQSNVAPAAAYAYHHGWVAATDMPEEHDPPIERQWAMVGVTDPEKITSAMARGYSPEDYTSEDRDLRMAAHAAAGEMVFEGTLLSNATELWRHEPDITDKSRVFHHPSEVYFKGNPTPWAELPAEDQLDYIRGYARAIVTGGDQDQRPRVEWDNAQAMGFVCGTNAVKAARIIDEGCDGTRGFRIVDPDAVGRVLVVANARPTRERHGYLANVAAGQKRRHHDDTGSRDVPWAQGAVVFFREDALGV